MYIRRYIDRNTFLFFFVLVITYSVYSILENER